MRCTWLGLESACPVPARGELDAVGAFKQQAFTSPVGADHGACVVPKSSLVLAMREPSNGTPARVTRNFPRQNEELKEGTIKARSK